MTKRSFDIPVLNEKLIAALQLLDGGMNGSRDSVINRLRQPAMEKFLQTGLPSPKHEEWRFTPIEASLKKISKISLQPAPLSAEVEKVISSLEPVDSYKLVLVNGKPADPVVVTMEGVEFMSLSEAQKKIPEVIEQHYGKYLSTDREAFNAINTALSSDGVILYVRKNVAVDKPFHLVHVHDNREEGNLILGRVLVVLEEGASASISETHISLSPHFSFANLGAEIKVAANARVEYQLVQHLSLLNRSESSVVDNRIISLEKDGFCNFTTVTLSGQLVRNNLTVRFDAVNGECHLYGLYMPSSHELFDNHTVVDHAVRNCFSNEFYKGILNGNGKGVFNGKILVQQDAQKTNAYQNNRNILLSDEAHINAKPQLEIFADDVKCTHGATTGQLDEEALFYLRTRGIGEQEAKKILTVAFAGDMLSQIKHHRLHQQLEKWIELKLTEAL